jgi:hypothetical protein
LRECLSRHHVSYEGVSRLWGLSKARTAVLLDNIERRLEQLPASVLADWHRTCAARLDAKPTRSVEGEHLDVVVELGRVTDGIRAALADGKVDDAERAEIRRLVAGLMTECEDLARAVS